MQDEQDVTLQDKELDVTQDSERTLRDNAPRPAGPRAGDRLGRYQILSELGRGGMGVVYRCLDTVSGIEVALKMLPPELAGNRGEMEEVRENFQLVSKLVHQNIAVSKTLERNPETGDYYLVMELVNGEDLRHWMRAHRNADGCVSLSDALPILRQVADALDYAHKRKVMHRDIKPGNVMVDDEGLVKILDFGLAAQIHTSMSHVSVAYRGTSGTQSYMAPEQWRGRAQGAAADQYSLAVMAYEMLSGHLPFESLDKDVLKHAVLEEKSAPVAGLPPVANRALAKALSKEPEERFETCMDFVDALSGNDRAAANSKVWWLFLLLLIAIAWGISQRNGGVAMKSVPSESQKKEATEAKGVEEQRIAAENMRIVAEKASEAERIAREKEENKRLMAEVIEKQGLFENFDVQLEKNNIDMGQTFGAHIDAFRGHLRSGKIAMEKDDYVLVKSFYEKADAELKWIKDNLALRKAAQRSRDGIAEEKAEAEKALAKQYALSSYNAAHLQESDGNAKYEDGLFVEAQTSYGQAVSGYRNAAEEARRGHLKSLEDKAGQLSGSSKVDDWQEILRLATEMEALDAAVAARWREMAEEGLRPKLTVRAMLNGREVPAALSDSPEQKTPLEWNSMSKGATLVRWLVYRENGNLYAGEIRETFSWSGRKTLSVNLKAIPFPTTITLPGNVNMEFVLIKAGSFMMGSPNSESGRDPDETQHRVTLTKDYMIGKYEVTQAQYLAIMGQNPSSYQRGGDYPVETVNWRDAMVFCRELTRRVKMAGINLPEGYEFTLPTEAQWEYAARGGHRMSGYKVYSGGNDVNAVAWYYENSEKATHPVGTKAANELGIHDMSGNVWEWCRDGCILGKAGMITDTYVNGVTDPYFKTGSYRVCRGGSWNSLVQGCRVAYRNRRAFSDRYGNFGFRVALAPVQ